MDRFEKFLAADIPRETSATQPVNPRVAEALAWWIAARSGKPEDALNELEGIRTYLEGINPGAGVHQAHAMKFIRDALRSGQALTVSLNGGRVGARSGRALLRPDARVVDRFWKFVIKTDDGCWVWAGKGSANNGYGHFGFNRNHYLAHRVAYAIEHGEVPAGVVVMHTCHNRLCVRPDHLQLGTQSENIKDAYNRGAARRLPAGADNPNASLSDEQVEDIRQRLAARTATQAQLAEEYGVTQPTISKAARGITYSARNVEDADAA